MRDLIKHDALPCSCFFNSSDWCISILAIHSVLCSLGGPLSHSSSVVVFFDREHPRFWNLVHREMVGMFIIFRSVMARTEKITPWVL